MAKFLLLLIISIWPFFSYAQLDCEVTPVPDTFSRGNGYWKGYVFQISEDYSPTADWNRDFKNGGANRKFKGYLKYNNDFLPFNSVNFDTRFGDVIGYDNDENFFGTSEFSNSIEAGCDVQLKNFGVILRSKITIPEGEPGIYRFTIGSDDGSRLNINGETLHDNWGTGKTYEYNENVINYYVPYEGGESVTLDLFYYEKNGFNRLSFNFERYLGPGEIEGSQDLCGIAPDPEEFGSRGPAAFLEGTVSYQWQFSTINDPDPDNWTDIPGANDLVYDVPAYNPENEESWSGARYYRRLATNTTPDGVEEKFASNVLTVNLSLIQGLDQQESGQNEWIGHIYRGIGDFSSNAYLGRMQEDDIFEQNFNFNGSVSQPNDFTPDYGCTFLTENFSVRYKMKLDVSPGIYTFFVRGDDGFRLSADEGATWIINDWSDGAAEPYQSAMVEISTEGQLDLVLEYYENSGGNLIDFKYEFNPLLLPLEWGEVSASACEQNNCLTWETIQEKNTSHFELERSYDGFTWEIFDNSVQAQGFSTEKTSYQFTDHNFMSGQVYYRIKQVDMDAAFAYSDVMRVNNYTFQHGFLPFPNPTVDKIRFFSKNEVTKLILTNHDYSVNKELEMVQLNENVYEVDLAMVKSGYYILSAFKRSAEKEIFKIIKK
ncbi:MAG: PA14 domain-containing protein [Anditalea sp.]